MTVEPPDPRLLPTWSACPGDDLPSDVGLEAVLAATGRTVAQSHPDVLPKSCCQDLLGPLYWTHERDRVTLHIRWACPSF
jgi:hypothetical protein